MGSNVDQKLYLYMAAFYKFVVFKTKECFDEMAKYRINISNQKIFNSELVTKSHERGIIVVDFDFKKPMNIKFINKNGTKITNYDSNTI